MLGLPDVLQLKTGRTAAQWAMVTLSMALECRCRKARAELYRSLPAVEAQLVLRVSSGSNCGLGIAEPSRNEYRSLMVGKRVFRATKACTCVLSVTS